MDLEVPMALQPVRVAEDAVWPWTALLGLSRRPIVLVLPERVPAERSGDGVLGAKGVQGIFLHLVQSHSDDGKEIKRITHDNHHNLAQSALLKVSNSIGLT